MSELRHAVFVGLAVFTVLMLVFSMSVWVHESAHKQIFRLLGVPSHLEIDLLQNKVMTVPEGNYASARDRELGTMLHALNEIVGYPFALFLVLYSFGIISRILRSGVLCRES